MRMTKRKMFEQVAQAVCQKPPAMTDVDCFASRGQGKMLCRARGHCRIAEKTEEQLQYVLSQIDRCAFLKACPGSGKTEVVGLKAAYDIQRWNRTPGGIAVLTFTNNAADVITRRVSQFVGDGGLRYPHFIGTIDSWLHGYIANPFGHHITEYKGKDGDRSIRLVEDTSRAGWLSRFQCRTRYCSKSRPAAPVKQVPLYANAILQDPTTDNWSLKRPVADTAQYVTDEDYFKSDAFREFRADKSWLTLEYLQKDLRKAKLEFWKRGFATYRDIETICYRLLENCRYAENLARRFPFIIVDECQDLSKVQLGLLDQLLKAGAIIHLVGDLGQAIFGFKGALPENVRSFAAEHAMTTQELSRNFRSVQPIVDVCGQIVHQGDVDGQEYSDSEPACVYFTYSESRKLELVGRFIELLKSRRISEENSAILARGNPMVSKLRPSSGDQRTKTLNMRLPTAIKLWQTRDDRVIDDALSCMGTFVACKFFPKASSNNRWHGCPHDIASPLSWRIFLARLLDACVQDGGIADLSVAWSQWAPRVRNTFRDIVVRCTDSLSGLARDENEQLPMLDGRNFRIPPGKTASPVQDTLVNHQPMPQRIRTTTIHQAKGETLDAVLVVSAPNKGAGGHWSEWVDNQQSESARFAYVASSRPRMLLAWAIPTPKACDRSKLEEMGFAAK